MTDYLELADAARQMGLSSEALKKRLIRGTVPGRKVDGRWMVAAPVTRHPVTPDVTTRDDGHHDDGVTPSPRDDLIERLHRENLELAGRCGWLQAQLQAAQDQVKLLSAPDSPMGERLTMVNTEGAALAENVRNSGQPPASTLPSTTPAASAPDSGTQVPMRRSWWGRVWNYLKLPEPSGAVR